MNKGGYKLSEETRRKMSESKKGNKYHLGHHHSEEAKRKIGLASKSHISSEETKRKISESLKGKSHIISEETKRKISESTRGRIRSEETRKKMSTSAKIRAMRCIEYKHICYTCGVEFSSRYPNNKWCSSECKKGIQDS